jgi:hypothetical protein
MQRHVLHQDRDKEVDGDHHEGCGRQENAVVLVIENTVRHKGSAFDELQILQPVHRQCPCVFLRARTLAFGRAR